MEINKSVNVVGKIVVRGKYFYTIYDNYFTIKDLSPESYKKLCEHCDKVMFDLINNTLKKKFIYLKVREAGVKSINSNIVEEVIISVEDNDGNKVKLNTYKDFVTTMKKMLGISEV